MTKLILKYEQDYRNGLNNILKPRPPFRELEIHNTKIYLSGRITGIKDFNVPHFDRMTKIVSDCGLTPVNPHNLFTEKEKQQIGDDWAVYMKKDLAFMMDCAAVFVISKDWCNSRGCSFEILTALRLNIPVFMVMAKKIKPLAIGGYTYTNRCALKKSMETTMAKCVYDLGPLLNSVRIDTKDWLKMNLLKLSQSSTKGIIGVKKSKK